MVPGVGLCTGTPMQEVRQASGLVEMIRILDFKAIICATATLLYSQMELDPKRDLSYYIRDHDDSPYASGRKRSELQRKSGPY